MTSEFPWKPVMSKQGQRDGSQVMMSLTLQSETLIICMWSRQRETERNVLLFYAISMNQLLLCHGCTDVLGLIKVASELIRPPTGLNEEEDKVGAQISPQGAGGAMIEV